MILSIKNGRYAFSKRLDLMFSMSLWKEFQLLQILNDLPIRYLIKLHLFKKQLKVQTIAPKIANLLNNF